MRGEYFMKKRIALILGMVLTVSALAGCTNKTAEEFMQEQSEKQNAVAEESKDDVVLAEGELKTGLAVVTKVGSSTDAAADAEGLAQTDVMIAAVTVDAEGKIVQCAIDSVQSIVNFGTDGKITTDTTAEVQTKNELGTNYGMHKASSIGKDWNEQAAAFAEYCIGKTADEVKGIAVAEGKAADADLAAGCTIYIGDFQAAVAQAAENASALGAQAGDKLGLGVVTTLADSADASAEAEGVAQTSATISALTVNADGVITSAVIDGVQANINFDTTGKITTDITAAVDSKNVLGTNYGMSKASAIGKEWNEQAAAYAQYATGKTVDEVNGTAVTEGVPSDADLAASVTIHITDFNTVITKAAGNAK